MEREMLCIADEQFCEADNGSWPSVARDGYPPHPEMRGWHWLRHKSSFEFVPALWWQTGDPRWQWTIDGSDYTPEAAAREFFWHSTLPHPLGRRTP